MTDAWAPPGWVAAALALGLAATVGWGARASSRARALERAAEALRAVVEELAEGRLSARASREPGAGAAAERLAAAVNDLARRLQEAQARRRRQEEAYRQLLADLSHDLRTPLTSIVGYVEALRTGAGGDPRRYLEIIAARSAALSRMVDDLLLLTRLEAGDRVIRPERADLAELVRRGCEAFADHFAARGIELAVEVPPPPCPAVVDGTAIARILANLLQNALHHAGSVRHVSVRLARDAGWVLEVANDGDPIEPGELPYIFERGFRSQRSSGTGLGLAIVRMLAEAHGGAAEARSDPQSRHTLFRVRLPASDAAFSAPPGT